jgi:hypothetical protein
LESNFIKFPEQFFGVVFSIKKLGSISYYIVNLHEKINDILETTKTMHEDGETNNNKIFEKNTVNKKFNKLTSKKNIRINSFLSSSTRNIKGNKEKEDIETIKRNTRTKVFFQVPSSNTSKHNNKKLVKEQITENSNINKEMTKKSENNSDNNNYIYKNEHNQSKVEPKKKTMNLDNLDLNKINNLQGKKFYEEEEIVPLISKENFNEILKKEIK